MKSLQITIIVAILLILFFFSGCAEKPEPATDTPSTDIQANQSSKQGSTYKTALFKATASLDPALVQTEYGVVLMHQLFDGLVKFGPYLQIKPALAKTWTIAENGTQYRFILQENARFHNGQPVTADDAVFSIQRLLRTEPPPVVLPHLLKIKGAEDYQKGNQETLTGLEAVDSLTLLITLEAPHAPFLTALGMYPAKIVPKEEVLLTGKNEILDLYIVHLKEISRGRGVLNLRRLLNLQRSYPEEPFIAGIKMAQQYGLYDLSRVEKIILNNVAGDFFEL